MALGKNPDLTGHGFNIQDPVPVGYGSAPSLGLLGVFKLLEWKRELEERKQTRLDPYLVAGVQITMVPAER